MEDYKKIIHLNNYNYLDTISKGSYGKIIKCVKDDKKYAVKIFFKYIPPQKKNILFTKLKILSFLIPHSNKYIVNFMCEYNSIQHFISYDLMDMNLTQYLMNNDFKNINCKYIANKLLNCLIYLHRLNIIHGDIKAENFLLKIINNTTFNIQLSDLDGCGISNFYNVNITTLENYPFYIKKTEEIDKIDDVFAIGIVFLKLFNVDRLFINLNKFYTKNKIDYDVYRRESLKIFKYISSKYIYNLLKIVLEPDKKLRTKNYLGFLNIYCSRKPV